MYNGRRIFRSGRATVAMSVGATVLFALVAVVNFRTSGWSWVTIGSGLAVVIGLGGIVESIVARIEITDEALVVTSLRGRHRYAVGEIVRIEEARASAPALHLASGRAVRLPHVGDSLGNSVRAWLRAQRPT